MGSWFEITPKKLLDREIKIYNKTHSLILVNVLFTRNQLTTTKEPVWCLR